METVGLLVFGIWIGSIIHTYYMRQILAEIKKMNQSIPSSPSTPVVPPKKPTNTVLMYCSDCDTGYGVFRNTCPNCGSSNRYLKNG